MMQPVSSVEEHEIIFDDDDDNCAGIAELIMTTARQTNRSPSHHHHHHHRMETFQPLAGNIDEAVQAAMQLESFLSSNSNSNSNNDNDNTTCCDNIPTGPLLTTVDDTTNVDSVNVVPIPTTTIGTRNHPKMYIAPTQAITAQQSPPLDIPRQARHITTTTTIDSLIQRQLPNISIGNNIKSINAIASSFDPYARQQQGLPSVVKSLFDSDLIEDNNDDDDDDTDVEIAAVVESASTKQQQQLQPLIDVTVRKPPGTVGFLEMEEEPPRTPLQNNNNNHNHNNTVRSIYDPIQTSSGLLLTHRRVPPSSTIPMTTTTTNTIRAQFEMEGGIGTASKYPRGHSGTSLSSSYFYPLNTGSSGNPQQHSLFPTSSSLTSILRYVRIWMIISAAVLVFGTIVLLHHTMNAKELTDITTVSKENNNNNNAILIEYDEDRGIFHWHDEEDNNIQLIPLREENDEETEQIILLPLPNPNQHRRRLEQQDDTPRRKMVGIPAMIHDDNNYNSHAASYKNQQKNHPLFERTMRNLNILRDEFDAWMERHDKRYGTQEEHQYRFQIWSHNHERIAEKNERHGPCTMTGENVFGSNHLQDLTSDEFKSQYLNGYYLSREPIRNGDTAPEHVVLGIHVDEPPQYHSALHDRLLSHQESHQDSMGIDYRGGCGTMEPAYDANSYPTSIDWRTFGAVTDIHSQSSCGACWAITAVETVESVYFISTGKLYDLAETEVIVCETNGEMCAGGWPEDAFDYVIKNNGLPLESDMPYKADFLVQVSDQIAGNSDQLNEETVASYQQQTCPSGGGNDNHSGDSASVSGSNTFSRYGKIKGYGYSTSKCVCYTDGSGCDCDHQNEGYAVRNLATYGPAVVCLDASTWQDYTGGILTSDSGCSMGFMDVNHCVQAVGYAYVSDEEYETEAKENQSGDQNKNSHSGSGSQDSTKRKGYWIVRNQWSTYWGMSGYAYVAMGDNTCGILNDMMQGYT